MEHPKLKANRARIIYRKGGIVSNQRPLSDNEKEKTKRLRVEASKISIETMNVDNMFDGHQNEEQAYSALTSVIFRGLLLQKLIFY